MEGGLEMMIIILVNWCAGASYYRWCRNMHSLLKTLTAMVAIVIVFMQIVTVVMVSTCEVSTLSPINVQKSTFPIR